MGGRKIEQLREALTLILADIGVGDYFSILLFSDDVQVCNLEQSNHLHRLEFNSLSEAYTNIWLDGFSWNICMLRYYIEYFADLLQFYMEYLFFDFLESI